MEHISKQEATQEIPSWAEDCIVKQDCIEYNGTIYPYAVMKKELVTAVPGFVGYHETKFLFISEETPKEYIRTTLIHEIICCNSHGIGRCKKALEQELSLVHEDIKKEYISYRKKVYEALAAYYKNNESMKDLYEEIQATHDALVSMSV